MDDATPVVLIAALVLAAFVSLAYLGQKYPKSEPDSQCCPCAEIGAAGEGE